MKVRVSIWVILFHLKTDYALKTKGGEVMGLESKIVILIRPSIYRRRTNECLRNISHTDCEILQFAWLTCVP